jgi:hypothetical protein
MVVTATRRMFTYDAQKRSRQDLEAETSTKCIKPFWTRCESVSVVERQTSNQSMTPTAPLQVYELRPREDHCGVDLIPDALPFGRLWYDGPNAVSHAIGYASIRRSVRRRAAVHLPNR